MTTTNKKWVVHGLKEAYVKCVVEAETEDAAAEEAYFNGDWELITLDPCVSISDMEEADG